MKANTAFNQTFYKQFCERKRISSNNPQFDTVLSKVKKNIEPVTHSVSASNVLPSTVNSSATQICPKQVAALYEKQTSLLNTRFLPTEIGVQTTVTTPPPFKLLSIDELLAQSKQKETSRAVYEATKSSPAPNTSLKWYAGDTLSRSESLARMDGAVKVTIGKNELPLLMEEIEKALARGESYLAAIEKFYDNKNHYVGGGGYDSIFIDPYTGTVKHALPTGFATMGDAQAKILHSIYDDDAVWDLAYDLQQFLKLRVFGETGNLSEEEVESIIAGIKERQENKDVFRFGVISLNC
ncbi:MAG: hypothetical protein LBC82_05455 [Oscillospiraceae bacterium]|jgi:hypothetical protein|nr:hypothetical protein [Oscillospiraceae bacterium]